MIDNNFNFINDIGSGGGQDIFSLEILGTDFGTYVDIGCREPINHNNTFLHYKYGWKGIALDIVDYSKDFHNLRESTPFYQENCISCDFKSIFQKNFDNNVIDYLSIDVEGNGDRFNVLKNVFKSEYEFKVITIEHDAYRGFDLTEKEPQREFLKSKGYILVKECNIIEDFWINPKYVTKNKYEKFLVTFNKEDDKRNLVYDWYKNIDVDYVKYFKLLGFKI